MALVTIGVKIFAPALGEVAHGGVWLTKRPKSQSRQAVRLNSDGNRVILHELCRLACGKGKHLAWICHSETDGRSCSHERPKGS